MGGRENTTSDHVSVALRRLDERPKSDKSRASTEVDGVGSRCDRSPKAGRPLRPVGGPSNGTSARGARGRAPQVVERRAPERRTPERSREADRLYRSVKETRVWRR